MTPFACGTCSMPRARLGALSKAELAPIWTTTVCCRSPQPRATNHQPPESNPHSPTTPPSVLPSPTTPKCPSAYETVRTPLLPRTAIPGNARLPVGSFRHPPGLPPRRRLAPSRGLAPFAGSGPFSSQEKVPAPLSRRKKPDPFSRFIRPSAFCLSIPPPASPPAHAGRDDRATPKRERRGFSLWAQPQEGFCAVFADGVRFSGSRQRDRDPKATVGIAPGLPEDAANSHTLVG